LSASGPEYASKPIMTSCFSTSQYQSSSLALRLGVLCLQFSATQSIVSSRH
jgi:hypothetical protein